MSEELKEKEQQLRDRLTSRKQEHQLRNRLKTRQEERRRSLSTDPDDSHKKPSRNSSRHHDSRRPDRRHHHRYDRDYHRHRDDRRRFEDDRPYSRHEDRHSPRGPPAYDPRYGPPYSHDPPPYNRRPAYPPPGDIDPFGRTRRSRSRSRSSVESSDASSTSSSSSSRSHSSSSRSSRSSSGSSRASSTSSRSSVLSSGSLEANSEFTKDQRTIFINQLIMRTTERDIKHYLKQQGIRIIDISMLRDKKTGRHKGCAYVELRHLEDVPKAVALSGQPPDFQRFPILVKASEAEKNYSAPKPLIVDAAVNSANVQRVYIGNLDPAVTQEQLMALFEPFGSLQKVALQTSSGISKGFAFLSFGDASAAYLAIQTMSGQTLLGRSMKTGWAQRVGEQSDEFPANASQKAQQAYQRLGQINLGLMPTLGTNVYNGSSLPATQPPSGTVAEARASLAAVAASRSNLPIASIVPTVASPSTTMASDPKVIGNADHPTPYLHVSNMFDKDQETEPNWAHEIQLDFEDESRKFGTLQKVKVLADQPGGQIYCQFATVNEATACAQALAGRWFDRRLLQVEFVTWEEFEQHAL
ncbi:RNA-binding protein 39 [Fistulifera solaris]|uniref:RNA-binding protein 39 n=1 Tax=Fistulifera solaris TaxID=1519565 RepID=A0A1Z5JX90_FISSO|nr:RNA-binding protein 39 [Fistulifera solaris]|eukprot:GAX18438.1 RNA-binding protein 39 [Fistulifera solaris]